MIAGLAAQAAGREESPDTESAQAEWATRLVTPGGWPCRFRRKAKFHASACGAGFHPVQCGSATDSATENIPPATCNPVIARRKTFGTSSHGALAGKGEKVG
jgi:hypothetical protein